MILIAITQFLAQIFLNRGLKLSRTVTASLMKNWYVIVSFLLDYFVIENEITVLALLGAFLVSCSSILVVYGKTQYDANVS